MKKKNIEAIYPLSPMQQGILFHTLYAPESGVYFEQLRWTFEGELNVSAFKSSWEHIVARHSTLRTAFIWESSDKLFQVVCRDVILPWAEHDWRGIPQDEQKKRMDAFLQEDSRLGFKLDQPPLMRCSLIRLADDRYQFVWSHHHLLLDGWSVQIILKELLILYEKIHLGENPTLPTVSPYQNYITWLGKQDISQAESFWREELQGMSEPASLMAGKGVRQFSPVKDIYEEQEIQLTEATTASLYNLARTHHITINAVLQGAWALLLNHYTGSEDVIFGITVSGRPAVLPGVESMVGLFINTLPVRVSVPPQSHLIPWLQELHARHVMRDQYAYSSLVDIQNWSDVPRGVPLFESIVVFENYQVEVSTKSQGRGLAVSDICTVEKSNYPLDIVAIPGSKLLLRFAYDRSLLSTDMIARLGGHFQILLKSMADHPNKTLADLPWLTESEQKQLLMEWNDTVREYPRDKSIHRLFEEQVDRTPDTVAVVFEGCQMSYIDLNTRANQLAHYLQKLWVGPDVLVGICVERSPEMIVGLLAILKAGGAYVPIDPSYPQERLAFMLEDTGISVLLSQKGMLSELSEYKGKLVHLDSEREKIALESKENPVSQVNGENLAYVMYTSGSTGIPKGISITHRGVNRLVINTNYVNIKPSDRIAQASIASFDAATFEIWGALLNGACLVGISKDVLLSPHVFATAIKDQKISVLFLTTALFNQIVQEVPLAFKPLRYLLFGGEAVTPRWARETIKNGSPEHFLHVYGPTENTTYTSWHPIHDVPEDATTIPIGVPISNTQFYVLDRYLQPVAVGVPGEMFIGGDGLARDYFNRPDLTAEKFIPNPYGEKGSRLYRTGDLVRYLPDGNIEFIGRIDHQVKLHGFRIELGEIEVMLKQHPCVQDVVVIVREDRPGEKRLIGYIVPHDVPPTTSELRSYLKDRLPDYMVPSVFVMLNEFPLTPNKKVNRKALPAPEETRPELNEPFLAPRTPLEEKLVKIWKEILGIDKVGIHDNFFELGGDSILSIHIIARARQEGFQLTAQKLFQHQTIEELAAVIGESTQVHGSSEQTLITGTVSLTPIQRWFFERNLAEPHHFNLSVLLEVPAKANAERLKQALGILVRHHDALRLRFVKEGSTWKQSYSDIEETIHFRFIDLSRHSQEEQTSTIEKVSSELQAGLNISQGPLLQATFFDLGADKPGRLLLVVHHLAVDGVSWGILLGDLETAYKQLNQGENVAFGPKTTSFKHWAQRLEEYSMSEAASSELNYWVTELSKPCAPLPMDEPAGKDKNTESSCATVTTFLETEQTRILLHEVPQVYNTQINDILLTALTQAFTRWTGQCSLLIDLEGHGREPLFEDIDVSRTVGWFTTIFPVRLELRETDSPGTALKSVKEKLRAIPHRGIGYGLLRYLGKDEAIRTQMESLPHPEVCFNYLGQVGLGGDLVLGLARESIGPDHSPLGRRRYILEINCSVIENRLQMRWTYSKNIHCHETVESLANFFLAALKSLIEHCRLPKTGGYTLSDFPLAELSQEELEQLTSESEGYEDKD